MSFLLLCICIFGMFLLYFYPNKFNQSINHSSTTGQATRIPQPSPDHHGRQRELSPGPHRPPVSAHVSRTQRGAVRCWSRDAGRWLPTSWHAVHAPIAERCHAKTVVEAWGKTGVKLFCFLKGFPCILWAIRNIQCFWKLRNCGWCVEFSFYLKALDTMGNYLK